MSKRTLFQLTKFGLLAGSIGATLSPLPALADGPSPTGSAAASSAASASPSGPPGMTATVTITDTGFTPPYVAVPVGGTVTWINKGTTIHNAWSFLENPNIDTGGLNPGQSFSMTFTGAAPGTYFYTDVTLCQQNANPGTFNCNPTPAVTIVPAQ